jgi:hypothetical protein
MTKSIFTDEMLKDLPRPRHNISDRGIGKLEPPTQEELYDDGYVDPMSGHIDSEALKKYCKDKNDEDVRDSKK